MQYMAGIRQKNGSGLERVPDTTVHRDRSASVPRFARQCATWYLGHRADCCVKGSMAHSRKLLLTVVFLGMDGVDCKSKWS